MANNTTLSTNVGSGDVIATDDVGGIKYQRVKLMDGTEDSTAVIPGDATNGLDVDVTRVQGTVTTSTTIAAALPAGGNAIGSVSVTSEPGQAANAGALPGVVDVIGGYDGANVRVVKTSAAGVLQVDGSAVTQPVSDGSGSLTVDAPVGTPAFVRLSDGAAAITTLPVSLATAPALVTGTATIGAVSLAPRTTGGLTVARTISAASTNATSVKASAGQVYGIQAYNLNASPRYLKLYNKASAPTVGSETPVATYLIPGNTAGAGFVITTPNGMAYSTGIAFALTTGIADADTGAVAANEIVVNINYF